ncbi:MAG: DUF5009 domain-containing protein [Candidatus Hydrogenedentes bacterium]|jgi:predicted acyltransferase|nr:DUF5009 domain-containing protein [Candidatus Hydrogenedentota bacterium]
MTDNSHAPAAAAVTAQENESTAVAPVKKTRMLSVDALRGFDMFWIIGGKEFFLALVGLLYFWGEIPEWLYFQLDHVKWEGFAAWDLIMPLFLFVSGVTIPFALSLKEGETRDWKVFYKRLFRRVVLLWIFGMIAQGNLLEIHQKTLYFYSNTLQSIAAGYVIAVLAYCYLKRPMQILLCGVLLIVYWLLMMFVPVPGAGGWALEPDTNLALWLDSVALGKFRSQTTTYAWILPSLGFGASVLLGSFAGQVLRGSGTPLRRFQNLMLLGVGCLFFGWLWSFHFPIIKHLWTSSMVLWAAGWSFLLLALFYLVVDIWQWQRWAYPFVVIGANAIAVYMAVHIVHLDKLFQKCPVLGAMAKVGPFIGATLVLLILWIPLWIMYRKKIFLRV